ncbi:MAG: hypothetical protein HY696_04110 [Deltaproteobacteria bacterium]|nr:hypothetical protein [Deltaproteobacteria bacterium]
MLLPRPNVPADICRLIARNAGQPLATRHYPSRGQSAIQRLYYHARRGRLFYKQTSEQNHRDCRVAPHTGTLAEREWWAYRLAVALGVRVPQLWLLNRFTTVQTWLDFPDGRTYATYHGVLQLRADNIFDCACYDWITGQIDRHDANYLYDYVTHDVILIDSAHSLLHYEGSLPDYLRLFESGNSGMLHTPQSTKIHRTMRRLTARTLRTVVPLRHPPEIAALAARVEQIQTVKTIADIIQLYRGRV